MRLRALRLSHGHCTRAPAAGCIIAPPLLCSSHTHTHTTPTHRTAHRTKHATPTATVAGRSKCSAGLSHHSACYCVAARALRAACCAPRLPGGNLDLARNQLSGSIPFTPFAGASVRSQPMAKVRESHVSRSHAHSSLTPTSPWPRPEVCEVRYCLERLTCWMCRCCVE